MNKTVYLNNSFRIRLDTTNNAKYTVKDKTIVSVASDGTIKAKKVGKTKITCNVYNDDNQLIYKYEVLITVKESKDRTLLIKKDYSSISTSDCLLQSYKLLKKGKSTKLSVKASGAAKVMYITSDKNVATVDKKGVVKGISKGYADITVVVYQNDKFYTYVVKVRVSDGTKDNNINQYLK